MVEDIKRLAKESYPFECGGFLASRPGSKEVSGVYPMRNHNISSPTVRFEIDPREFQRVEDSATRERLQLSVFYHSHPDHPAQPSLFDIERAAGLAPFWPGLSYLIISVRKVEDLELSSWVFNEAQGAFDREEFVVIR